MKKTQKLKFLQVADFYQWLQSTLDITGPIAEFIVGYTKSSSNNPIATYLKQKHSLHSVEIDGDILTLWDGEDINVYIEPVPEWAKQFLTMAGQQPYEEKTITVMVGNFPVEIDLSKAIINQNYDYDGDIYYEADRLMTNRRAISILESLSDREVLKAIKLVDTRKQQAASEYYKWMAEAQDRGRNEWGGFHEDDMRNHFPDKETYQNWVDSSD